MKLLALALAVFTSTAAFSKAAPAVDPKRTVKVIGEVNGNIISQGDALLKLSKNPGNIDIVISSPGGSVAAGTFFITAMDMATARGNNLRCYVSGLAASMAFQILAHCSERYALPTAYLLWHPVRAGFMMASFTPLQAAQLAEDLGRTEEWATNDLIGRLFDDEEDFFWHHYHAETLFVASELAKRMPGLVTIVDDMPGVDSISPAGGAGENKQKGVSNRPYEILFRMNE